MNRFEDLVHTARREQGELSVERFGELWAESQAELLGDSVRDHRRLPLAGGPTSRTSSARPATSTPTPTASCSRCRSTSATSSRAPSFVPRYLELLAAGGSRSPQELGQIVGIDLADPGFWDAGLDLVERQLQEAEAAAQASGRL